MILLDTNALIFVALGRPLRNEAGDRIEEAARNTQLCVSAASAWELCFLERSGPTAHLIGDDGAAFFRKAVRLAQINVVAIDERVAIESRRLPMPFHDDPADRFLVATARLLDMTLVTRDRAILDYAAQGHLSAIMC